MKKAGNKVFVITGEQGAGKTSCLLKVIEDLKTKGVEMRGFVAVGYWKDGLRSGFDLKDIMTNKKQILCRDNFEHGDLKIGRFYFKPAAIKFGNAILTAPKKNATELIVIDEIGLFEVQGKLWSDSINKLLTNNDNPILITIRKEFVENVVTYFNLGNLNVYNHIQPPSAIADEIYDKLA